MKVNPIENNAEKATRVLGVLHEPCDEIENDTISKEMKEQKAKDNPVV